MPQLEVSAFFSQVFWFLVLFFLLFSVISFLFLPRLDEIISIRSNEVLDSFNSSMHLLKLIENYTVKYNTTLTEARARAKKVIGNALIHVEKMRLDMKDILEKEDKRVSSLIEKEVDRFKSEHNDKLKRIAVDIASIYYSKLTNLQLEKEFVASFVSFISKEL